MSINGLALALIRSGPRLYRHMELVLERLSAYQLISPNRSSNVDATHQNAIQIHLFQTFKGGGARAVAVLDERMIGKGRHTFIGPFKILNIGTVLRPDRSVFFCIAGPICHMPKKEDKTVATNDIFSVKIPDSKMAREVTQLIRDTESELLFSHSTRVYFWGALLGKRKGLIFDPELLYVAAMFHDVGLTSIYRESQLRFEVDSANAARDFLRSHNISEGDIEKVWNAVALHTTPGIPEHMHSEIALVQAGAGMDVAGRGFEQFTDEQREAVIAAYPRDTDFAHKMIDEFYHGMQHRPNSTFGTFNDDFLAYKDQSFQRVNLCSIILGSNWER